MGTRERAIRLCASWSTAATLVRYIVDRAYTIAEVDISKIGTRQPGQHLRPLIEVEQPEGDTH